MRLTLAACALLVFAMTTPALGADREARDLAGVWLTSAHKPRLLPMDGRALPFTATGRAAYEKNVAGLKSGALVDQTSYLCLPEGTPRAMTSAYPFQIMMTPGQVTFAYEANRAFRLVHFTDKHADPATWDPSFMGDGIAGWNGDTLVIDTTNFNVGKIYLDASGLPASKRLHVVERIRLTNGGRRLEDVVTVDDPEIFSRPWTAQLTFNRRQEIELKTDWVCGEPHRDVSAVMRGASR
jgi:hypothetical protein